MFERIKIPISGHSITAYSKGTSEDVLLLLHGGPGYPSPYLREAHWLYADKGLRVITWDQLGCGESDQPTDYSLYTVKRFVEEVEQVRSYLNLKKVHLLGQSWGGLLAVEYLLRYQKHIESLILVCTTPSVPLFIEGLEQLRIHTLGNKTAAMMGLREAEGSTDHPEYEAAQTIMFYKHICNTHPMPEPLRQSNEGTSTLVMDYMFGKHLFRCTGTLNNWSRADDLHRIQIPTLILHGEDDQMIPACASLAHAKIPDSKLYIFKDASHMPFWETPKAYHQVLGGFLKNQQKSSKKNRSNKESFLV